MPVVTAALAENCHCSTLCIRKHASVTESRMSLSSSPVPSELLPVMITEFMFLTTLCGVMILSGGPGNPEEMLPGY